MAPKPRLLALVVLCFPFSLWPQDADYWVSLPYQGGLVITGVSNRRLGGEGEIESAREDAAQKLLWYYGIQGTVHTVLADGPEGFRSSSEVSLEPCSAANLEGLRETLRYDPARDVFRTEGAVFVRFTCEVPGAQRLDYEAELLTNGAPRWIHRPVLEIGGYTAAVGFSGPRRYVKDAVITSREDAAAALLVSSAVQMKTFERESADGERSSYIEERAEGKLLGFMVLEIWIDPQTKAVWTLAAARRGE